MVKLATTLPKEYDDNGLESNSRHLLDRYTSQEYTPAIVLLRTKDVHNTEDFERIPRVEIVVVEPAFDAADAEEIRALRTRLHDARVRHIKQPMDLPTDEPETTTVLELEVSDNVIEAEVIEETEEPTTNEDA